MTRNGKVARLPHAVRQELNVRLQNGEPGRALVKWLNELPEVKAVMEEHYHGEPVKAQNVSDWKRGGYQDWLRDEETRSVMNRFLEEAAKAEVSPERLTDEFMKWMLMRYVVKAKLVVDNRELSPEDGLKQLRRLCRDVVRLRRGNHYERWLGIVDRRLEMDQNKSREKMEEAFLKWAEDPVRMGRLHPKPMSPEEKMAKYKEIFGML